MAGGNGDQLTQVLGQGMQSAAQAGYLNTPAAGGSPVATPAPSSYGQGVSSAPQAGGPIQVTGTGAQGQTNTVNNTPASASPYSSFLTALNQVQQASPIQQIGSVTQDPKRFQAPQPSAANGTNVQTPKVG
jgi:hypothetical protein